MKIYIAHPISGYTTDEVFRYYDELAHWLWERGYEVLSPMLAKDFLRTDLSLRAHSYVHPLATNHAIIERDRWMVSMADVVYLNLLGANHASIGCMMELAWAHDRGIHTVVVLSATDKVHRHAFVLEAADILFETEAEAKDYLSLLASGHRRYGQGR